MQRARQLGRYQLLDRVAFGGMAEIYRAKTADADGRTHLVAVKRVLGHLCEDDEFIQMLVDEAKITAALQHENIARIYEFCRTDREYFIAMEYVDGKDVRALLEKARQSQEPLPEEHVAWVGMEVARALHAAHTQRDRDGRPLRIVHRDVSPSNVLLSYGGQVKLCDFGIAKATLTRVQTKTGVIKGKVKYMSPEQAMGRKLDHRSDLFSLGTLLYEMLTLQAPFQAPTEIELIFAVRDARKRPLRELRPGVNPHLEVIVDRAMARSRSQRFQSGEELAQSLEAFLQQVYPAYRRSDFGRFMKAVFAREIDRELRQLEDYVIEGGRAEDVGENLLADVLGPNAPYTQFTAAFVDGARDLLDMTTGAKERLPEGDLLERDTGPQRRPNLLPPEGDLRRRIDAGWGPDAPIQPAASSPPAYEPAPAPRAPGDAPQHPGDGWDAVHAGRGEDSPPPGHEDGSLHDEETRILTRAQIAAHYPELHEAQTRIFDLRSLPAHQQEALRGGVLPALSEEAGDLHEAQTAFLPRARFFQPGPGGADEPGRPQRSAPPGGELRLPGTRVPPRPAAGEEEDTAVRVRLERARRAAQAGRFAEEAAEAADPGESADTAAHAAFNDQPTQPGDMPHGLPHAMQSGSVELSTEDVSFVSARHPQKEGDRPEPSVVISEDDLEAVE